MSQELAFTALYSLALRSWISQLSDPELRLFVLLCTYADELGMCFPGITELSRRASRSEQYVRTALDGLVQKQLIVRLDEAETDPQKRKALRGHVTLSSQLLRITLANQNQNQNQEPKSVNQNQEPSPPTTTASKSSLKNVEKPSIDSPNVSQGAMPDSPGENINTVAKTTKPARSATSGADAIRTLTPPLSPSPPESDEHESLSRYREPMPETEDEALANELYLDIFEMAITVARRLIARHGRDKVRTTLVHFRRQPQGSLHTPAGWFIHQLEKLALVPEKDGEQKENKAGYGGAYAEFVNR